MIARLLVALALVAACKRASDHPPPSPAPPAPAVAPAVAPSDAAAPAPAPRDPRIAALFTAGTSCTWNAIGLASCDAAEKMHDLAFQNQGDSDLAASCMGALRDPEKTIRGLAAVCMGGFTDATRTPFLPAALDAFEAEKDLTIAHAISWAFSNGNAAKAGVEPRVIALVGKLVAAGDDDAAANFLDSMFPQYLMGNPLPSHPAGDLALALARKAGPHTQVRALEDIGLLADRVPEVCAALGDALPTEQWAAALDTLAKLGAACTGQIAPAVDTMARHMAEGTYEPALLHVLQRVPLTAEQVTTLRAASRKLVAKAADWERANARSVAKLLSPYHAPH